VSEMDRSQTRVRVSRWLSYGEDALYLVAGVLLAATAATVLYSAARIFVAALGGGEVISRSVEILDAILLTLLIVEIMHTIRVSVAEHRFLAEPFLVVALIAGVRRLLVLSVEAAEFLPDHPEQFERALMELGVLLALFVVLVGSLVLLRRLRPPEERES